MSDAPVKLTPDQVTRLSHYLDALDEWGCEDNEERAKELAEFMAGGFDLSSYEEDRPDLRVIDGGLSPTPPGGSDE